MRRFLYFAYGSNMLTARLQARCASATPVGIARAEGYGVAFRKPGRDRSGKATLFDARAERALGVVFEIDRQELPALDRAEGAGSGYDRLADFPVRLVGGSQWMETATYIATQPQAGLKPFCWYLALVLAGADEHKLGEAYLERLRREAFDLDPDEARQERLIAVDALLRAGYADYRTLLGLAFPKLLIAVDAPKPPRLRRAMRSDQRRP